MVRRSLKTAAVGVRVLCHCRGVPLFSISIPLLLTPSLSHSLGHWCIFMFLRTLGLELGRLLELELVLDLGLVCDRSVCLIQVPAPVYFTLKC